ncbi:histidine kinase/DNA gyrase B/HSP90-like ATPase [Hoeflea marina]|uniref:histidine kinase n=1 Tax=Hoeflea marina TaxID=274592 RepID=A0A317PMI9_9HYPH|nr:HAMP domain-containing sensor histidine kinase [Hoeflea marina]PWW01977.1 histidine kinase/DNA gyrase B/HSP90-like ATPase [Hoeflea marina]
MNYDNLIRLNKFVYENTDINQAAFLICNYVVKEFPVRGCAMYLYNRLKDNFEVISLAGHANFPSEGDCNDPEYRNFICYRNSTKCGFLALDCDVDVSSEIDYVSSLIVLIFNRKFVSDLLEKSSAPVDYLQDEFDFYSDLRNLAKESSGMPAGAFRARHGVGLKTVFHWNDWSGEVYQNSDWDIEDIRDTSVCPFFKECLDKNEVVTASADDVSHLFFHRRMQKGVKSAVFSPVNVGSETIGVLSFAIPRDYVFSSLEKLGFLSLANSIGVSLTNFSRSATAALDLQDDVRISQILTAVEIAQAARHSARADLDTLKTYILTAGRILKGDLDNKTRMKVSGILSECDASIGSCFKSLDDIKSAIRPPARKLKRVNVSSLFESAKMQVRGRIVKNNVDVRWIDRDAEIECYPDHLKQVFLNLLLNSVDAFAGSRRQGNRNIRARLHNYQENALSVAVRFEDDAGGIDVAGLRTSANDHVSPVEDLVFAKDITTKGVEGSGWGLYVSRKIVADHGGHMSLIEYRGKTVFDILLKKVISI